MKVNSSSILTFVSSNSLLLLLGTKKFSEGLSISSSVVKLLGTCLGEKAKSSNPNLCNFDSYCNVRKQHESDENISLASNYNNGNVEALRRRSFLASATSFAASCLLPKEAFGAPEGEQEGGGSGGSGSIVVEQIEDTSPVEVVPTGDVKKLFNEARAREVQGNVPTAQRIYYKIVKVSPKFIYGWSSLGNTQVALGQLQLGEESYTKAIQLCQENLEEPEKFGVPRCKDLYLLLLNRGSLRMNNNMIKESLADLELSDKLRGAPDALILSNRARARELNGLYRESDSDYSVAISMTSNDVTPLWLRSALVKYQLGDLKGALELAKRVEVKFPDEPEVVVTMATLMVGRGDVTGARQKFLTLTDRQREKYTDKEYLEKKIAWPPRVVDALTTITEAARTE